MLQAFGKRFRDRTPRDPQRVRALAGIWLRAELIDELVIAGADRRPAADWRLLCDLCSETLTRLTFVVERRRVAGCAPIAMGEADRIAE